MLSRILAGVAAGLIVLGLAIGLVPVSAGGTSCGSAFVTSQSARVADYSYGPSDGLYPSDRCDSLRSIVRIPAIALLALGGAALFAAVATWPVRRYDDTDSAHGASGGAHAA